MQRICGKRNWIFPDGELPPAGSHELKGHESIIILNTASREAEIDITLYYTDRDPTGGIKIRVGANRVRCLRMDNPEDLSGVAIPRETQYSIRLESSVPVVVEYGRLDTREQPMAFYTNTGYWE
jgi:hypothetical protein